MVLVIAWIVSFPFGNFLAYCLGCSDFSFCNYFVLSYFSLGNYLNFQILWYGDLISSDSILAKAQAWAGNAPIRAWLVQTEPKPAQITSSPPCWWLSEECVAFLVQPMKHSLIITSAVSRTSQDLISGYFLIFFCSTILFFTPWCIWHLYFSGFPWCNKLIDIEDYLKIWLKIILSLWIPESKLATFLG